MRTVTACILTASILGLTSCTSTGTLFLPTGDHSLVKKINAVIESSEIKPNLGIKIVSLKTGKTLYSLNSDHLYTPASNNKLYTAAAALKLLHPQFRFETGVWIDSSALGDTVVPRLTLKGTGDPDLKLQNLEQLAQEVSRHISQIDTLVLDPSAFDDIRFGQGWMWDEGSAWYFAQVGALTVNDNCVNIIVRPGNVGEPPLIDVIPNTEYIEIQNSAITKADTTEFVEFTVERRWQDKSNIIEITGNILVTDEERIYWRNIEDPTQFTGKVFAELLHASGVEIQGPTLIRILSPASHKIAIHKSLPLTNSIMNFMKSSDNLTGELLVKTIGLHLTGEQGTWENGLQSLKTFLNNEVGIDTTLLRMADGSGISRYNLTSPDQLVQLLTYIYNDFTINAEFLAALPTGGWDGTLRRRLRSYTVNRRIRAKTGTLAGVSCLSGFAYTLEQEPLAFSIMVNGYVGGSKPYRQLQDDICTEIITYSR